MKTMSCKLISGTPYPLKKIFTGENEKVIIPDLQRDYCWGNPISGQNSDSLVNSFIDSIFKLDKSQDITMGLIYGYYDKLVPYHLQLCDGQQRLTTLFLLLGVLNRKLNNKYRAFLISDFEYNEDDNEPHLLYGIRESSLYFLSDLVCNFFCKPDLDTDEIANQPWFLTSYKEDPTINSILNAIRTIEERLKECENYELLADFLLEHLHFLFYDMTDRQNGEETFVVINTTGEPLSANQNLKPLIIIENPTYCRVCQEGADQMQYDTAHDWEEMETWFWRHRNKNGIDTANEGMLAFLHCVRVLECRAEADWHRCIDIDDDKFPLTIQMEQIWDWFVAYKKVYTTDYRRLFTENIVYPNTQNHYTQKALYSLLPAMVFCRKFPEASSMEVQRIYHMFDNMSRYRTVNRSSKNEAMYVPAFRNCKYIAEMDDKDILSLLSSSFNVSEEREKLLYVKENCADLITREKLEESFASAESYPIFNGQISTTLVKWSNNSITEWYNYYEKVTELWIKPDNLNRLRRALLAYGLPGYPMNTASVNKTLCSGEEWRTLMENQGEAISKFIKNEDLDKILQDYTNISSPYYLLIHDEHLIDFCQGHRIREYSHGLIEIMSRERASAYYLFVHRNVIFEKDMFNQEFWGSLDAWSDGVSTVFYVLSNNINLTLDIRLADSNYQIVAWLDRRPKLPTMEKQTLENIGFCKNGNEWVYPSITDPLVLKEKILEIAQAIESKS